MRAANRKACIAFSRNPLTPGSQMALGIFLWSQKCGQSVVSSGFPGMSAPLKFYLSLLQDLGAENCWSLQVRAVSGARALQLQCPYLPVPRGHIQFPLGPRMWAGVGSIDGLSFSAVSGVHTCLGGELSLPRGLGAMSCRLGSVRFRNF